MSAWQAAIFRTFYAEKQKGKQLFNIGDNSISSDPKLEPAQPSPSPPSDIVIEKKISESDYDNSSRPKLFKRLRNKKSMPNQ